MNQNELLDAIGGICGSFILSAGKKLEEPERKPAGKPRLALRRSLGAVTAVLVLLVGSFTVAMAASPALRNAVFAFLRLEETVKPQEETQGPADVTGPSVEEQGQVGGKVNYTYLTVPVQSHARNGLVLVCADEIMMNSGNHFDAYKIENGEMVKLERKVFSRTYTVLGNTIPIDFEWVAHENNCVITYSQDKDALYRKLNYAGPLEATVFELSCKVQGADGETHYTDYPVLINMNTGELTDILAGTGAEKLEIVQSAITPDRTGMLLYCGDGTICYADLKAKKLHSVDDLSGEKPDACALIGDTLACWVLEGDSIETASFGTYRGWAIDLNTLQRRETFTAKATAFTSHDVWSETYGLEARAPEVWDRLYGYELPPMNREGMVFLDGFDGRFYWGNMFAGSPFALEVDGNRTVFVMDLATGEKVTIPGFTWPGADYPEIECLASPDGKKLLVYVRNAERYYESIGVLDFEKHSYTQLDRENLRDVNEHTIYWFDNDSVMVRTSDIGEVSQCYLYELGS